LRLSEGAGKSIDLGGSFGSVHDFALPTDLCRGSTSEAPVHEFVVLAFLGLLLSGIVRPLDDDLEHQLSTPRVIRDLAGGLRGEPGVLHFVLA
jgi:hypothetical protein